MNDAKSVWVSNVTRNLGPKAVSIVVLSYVVDAALLTGFAMTNVIPLYIPFVYLAAGAFDITLFYSLAGLITPSRERGAFLAVQRLIVSAAIQLTFMALVPPVSVFFLTSLFTVFAFGSMGMSPLQGLFCWSGVAAALAMLLNHNQGMTWLPQENNAQKILVWVTFAVILGRAATIGSFGRAMTVRLQKRGEALAATRAKLQESLTGILKGVKESATSVATAARELNAGTLELSTRTGEQAANLKETAASMQQMTSTVKQNADNAKRADEQALAARDKAEQGGAIVQQAVEAMDAINVASSRIAAITSVIDELAFQTNLLALNAAVEAARAGEQGRGFAVVASEVRSLAHRSAGAAKEITALINDSVAKVSEGARLVSESGRHLEEIVAAVKDVTNVVGDITTASQEQAASAEEISRVVLQMDDSTQRNAAMVHQASAAAALMNDEAKRLIELTAQFQLEEADQSRKAR